MKTDDIISRCFASSNHWPPLLSESAVFWLPTFDDDNKYPLMQSWREGGIVIASRATQADDSRKVQLPSISRLLSVPSAKDVHVRMYAKFSEKSLQFILIFKRDANLPIFDEKKNCKYLRFSLFLFRFKFRSFIIIIHARVRVFLIR